MTGPPRGKAGWTIGHCYHDVLICQIDLTTRPRDEAGCASALRSLGGLNSLSSARKYEWAIAFGMRGHDDVDMKKRIFATFLWFYVGWYAGAILAIYLGVSPLLGPILGAAAAALFVGDPRHIVWSNTRVAARAKENLMAGSPRN